MSSEENDVTRLGYSEMPLRDEEKPITTPGPWEASSSEDGEDVYVVSETRGLIATMEHGGEQGRTDARLAAAAPDLLDALRALMAATENVFDETPNEWTEARDAIDKATGESP